MLHKSAYHTRCRAVVLIHRLLRRRCDSMHSKSLAQYFIYKKITAVTVSVQYTVLFLPCFHFISFPYSSGARTQFIYTVLFRRPAPYWTPLCFIIAPCALHILFCAVIPYCSVPIITLCSAELLVYITWQRTLRAPCCLSQSAAQGNVLRRRRARRTRLMCSAT